ncbi:MAG TPA: glutaredoxin [Gammaproteobacteria bacterium]|nr:glutaredoxin [Gammaproteobacteria bacterium]
MIVKATREGLGRLIIFIDFITRPAKMKRSDAEQQTVNEALSLMSVYQFYACPFCVKTRRALHRLNLTIALRDASKGSPYRDELQNGGGQIKVPCLRIDEGEKTRWLYESNDIIAYLENRFGKGRESQASA